MATQPTALWAAVTSSSNKGLPTPFPQRRRLAFGPAFLFAFAVTRLRGFLFFYVLLDLLDLHALLLHVQLHLAEDAHVDVRNPDERQPRDRVSPPVVIKKMEA